MSEDKKKIIVVLGMHRSGTSAIAGLLAHMGVTLGDNLIPAGPDNEKGFWEDASLVALNDELLSMFGYKWSDCREIKWSEKVTNDLVAQFQERAKALMVGLLDSSGAVCAVKDPRISRLLPFWKLIFKQLGTDVSYIWVVRRPNGVCQSLKKRNGFDVDKSAALWLRYNKDIAENIEENNALLVDYDSALSDESAAVGKLIKACNIEFNKPEGNYFEAALRHCQKDFIETILANSLWARLAQDLYFNLSADFDYFEKGGIEPSLEQRCEFVLGSQAQYLDTLSDLTEACVYREKSWLEEQNDRLSDELSLLSENYDKRAVYLGKIENETLQLRGVIERQDAKSNKLEKDNEALAFSLEEQKNENKRLGLCLDKLEKARKDIKHEREEAMRDVEIKRTEIRGLWENVNELTARNESMAADLGAVYGSSSWRLMAGYRFLGRGVKALARLPKYMIYYLYSLAKKVLIKFFHAASSKSNSKSINQLAVWRSSALDAMLITRQENIERQPHIDITVVTYNSERWLDGFFKSLVQQDYPVERISLIFTDNGSMDGTLERLKDLARDYSEQFERIDVQSQPNKGFGSGHDYAIGRSSSKFVLVSNVDLEFSADSISSVVTQAVTDDGLVASWELRQQPFEHPKYYDPVTLDTAWSSHACILIRRSAYEVVGGYEKKIFMYGEDVELSYRFRRAGYRIKYIPSAVVFHYTYEYENQIKPIQFYGSTLANAYIRLRYGSFMDVLGIFGLYGALIIKGGPIKGARAGLIKNLGKIFLNASYFLASRKKSVAEAYYPFRFWDYEMIREGAFYQKPLDAGHSKPLVSVVTRTYAGREEWLREAIASVLQQTYPNVELIVVEDGGESQKALVDRYQELFMGGKILRYSAQPKNGRSYNGNAGLAMAKGEFMVFLDDDDLLFPDHIEVLMDELLADDSLAASYSLAWEVLTRNQDSGNSHYYEEVHNTPDVFRQEFNRDLIRGHNYLPIQSVVFKRELFDRYGGFDTEMDQLEDWDLWVRYSSEQDFKYVPKTTSLFRTPHCTSERAKRHQLLHESYDQAISKQKSFFGEDNVVEG